LLQNVTDQGFVIIFKKGFNAVQENYQNLFNPAYHEYGTTKQKCITGFKLLLVLHAKPLVCAMGFYMYLSCMQNHLSG